MNTIAIDNRTYREVEAFAKLHNLDIAEVVRTSLQNFLQKFKVAKPQASKSPLARMAVPI